MTTRIHFHTDCYWFGGSEFAPALVAADASGRENVVATFSYRQSQEYERGLRLRMPQLGWAEPVRLREAGGGGTLRRLLLNRYTCVAWDTLVLYRLLRRRRPQILHVNNGGYPGAASCHAAVLAGRLARVRVIVYFVNNLAFDYVTLGRRLERPLDRLIVGSVNRFATASAHAAGVLRDVLSLSDDQVAVLPNTVIRRELGSRAADVRQRLGIAPDAVMAVAIGRLEKRKGHRVLIDALAGRTEGLERLVLLVAGDGPEDRSLRHQLRRLGLEERVRLLGQVDDAWDLLAAADLVVLPSVGHEDFPIVILEAMAAGRPVVASVVAGTPEQVEDGVTGLLVPPGDRVALAAAIADLVSDPARRERMGQMAKQRYNQSFTPERAIDRYWALYDELLQATGSAT